MITIYNDFIPFGHYKAITLWPFLFIKNKYKKVWGIYDITHENIHGRQQCEMLVAGTILAIGFFFLFKWWSLLFIPLFYWWYIVEYLLRFLVSGFNHKWAYRNISYEQEAYGNQYDLEYLNRRRIFAWLPYVCKNVFK